MALINCNECNGQMSENAASCPHCGNPNNHFYFDDTTKDFSEITNFINDSSTLRVRGSKFKQFSWFFLTNAAIILSISIVSAGAFLKFAPFFLIIGCIFPFISLLFSKWLP